MASISSWIRERFTRVRPLPAVTLHYQSPPGDEPAYRLHLRMQADGSGLLIVNAATVLHLNPTAAEYAYHMIKGTPPETVALEFHRRYRVGREIALRDFAEFRERVQTLISTPDLDPVTYLDFERLHRWTLAGAFFVTRARKNFRFDRIESRPVDKGTGVLCDQTIRLVWFYSSRGYPSDLRRIRYRDPQTNKRLVFLTNNFTQPAEVIADLYRCRWQVELFFKWIKQHLRIKAFYGTSENAVKTQVWTAVCSYLLVAIARQRLQVPLNLYTILQILSVSLFEKTPINQAFSTADRTMREGVDHNQLSLLDF